MVFALRFRDPVGVSPGLNSLAKSINTQPPFEVRKLAASFFVEPGSKLDGIQLIFRTTACHFVSE